VKPDMQIGYCGNVHPALSVDQVLDNVQHHASTVRDLCYPNEILPFGIWVSKTALDQLQSQDNLQRLRDAMQQHHVSAFTINGFPFGDFHQPHLPLKQKADDTFLTACANQLRSCAASLAELKIQTGRHCTICIEPEPGCVLDTATDVCQFFNEYLFSGSEAETVRSHIGVCHDVCHSAVMFEDQADAIEAYAQSGINIGKVQVSSAVEVDFGNLDDQQKLESLQVLSEFSEPKYLHQTCIKIGSDTIFYQDLVEAIDGHPDPEGVWRIHFHVPIFASSLGKIGTTQAAIAESDRFVFPQHFEIETYAWNVLPLAHRGRALTTDIAEEISWFRNLVKSR